jgi:hypothetical protein
LRVFKVWEVFQNGWKFRRFPEVSPKKEEEKVIVKDIITFGWLYKSTRHSIQATRTLEIQYKSRKKEIPCNSRKLALIFFHIH